MKELAGIYKKDSLSKLTNVNSEVIIEESRVAEVWRDYTYSIFNNNRAITPPAIQDLEGPSIMMTEVEYAIKITKSNKAPGPGEVYTGYLKMLDSRGLKYLIKLFALIYDTGEM